MKSKLRECGNHLHKTGQDKFVDVHNGRMAVVEDEWQSQTIGAFVEILLICKGTLGDKNFVRYSECLYAVFQCYDLQLPCKHILQNQSIPFGDKFVMFPPVTFDTCENPFVQAVSVLKILQQLPKKPKIFDGIQKQIQLQISQNIILIYF